MLVVTLQRKKCIGCNYCVELAPAYFRMSKKDGKTTLLNALDKKGFHTLKSPKNEGVTVCEAAAEACPVNIIKVKLV